VNIVDGNQIMLLATLLNPDTAAQERSA